MKNRSAVRRGRLIVASGICAALIAAPLLTHSDQGPASGNLASAEGNSVISWNTKVHCITPSVPGGTLTQSDIDAVTAVTGVTYNCLNTFANPSPSWSAWEHPWMFSSTSYGYDAWLAASSSRQIVMGMDLVPQPVGNVSDPLKWEQPCAYGAYNSYAAQLGKNLVSYGAGNIVIRLGPEANGNWEADYIGTTATEMADWAKCYANEVSAMRTAAGNHFLFVWNPNNCTADIPLSSWYPGDHFVSIIGSDAYDTDCGSGKTVAQEGWKAFYTNSSSSNWSAKSYPSLANIEQFAVDHGKPMSFPEWGMNTGIDDPAYVLAMANMFHSDSFAYESYFDDGDGGTAELGAATPQSTAAYASAFK